jgi:DNA polymerase elongation subunit (family B)
LSNNFYTSVQSFSNYILYRGIKDGKRVKERIDYSPSLFLPSKRITNYTNLEGEYLEQKIFPDIKRAREFIKQFDGVSNASKIYGQTRYEYAYIADEYSKTINFDFDKVSIAVVDIEVGSENGFPDPYEANEPITAIAVSYLNGKTYVFGCGIYETQGDEIYVKCKDEYSLCRKFMELWTKKCPDMITGWNTKFFDIPYLVNRFRKILGEPDTKKLSPWNFIGERKTTINGRSLIAYELLGVASLDYIELYKWYAPGGKSQESYKLGDIAQVELGEGKVSFDEYDNLFTLLTSSDGVTVDKNKPIENMKLFERWCLLKDTIKEELKSRK